MEFIIYLFKVSACMAMFYGLYHLLFIKLSFFTMNRWYLISSLVFSFIIPLLYVTVKREVTFPEINLERNVSSIQISNESTSSIDPELSLQTGNFNYFSFETIIFSVYLIVLSFLLLRFSAGLYKILTKYKVNFMDDNYKVVLVSSLCSFKNSSFFRYIFIESSLSDIEQEQVILHEKLHVSSCHFIDKLISNLVACILWFNPFSYFYLNAINTNHEFEVDAKSILKFDKKTYANLILKLAHNSNHSFVNHFSKLPLKKRMYMLFKNPTNPMKKLIYLSVLPLIAICSLAFVKQKEVLVYKANQVISKQKNLQKNRFLTSDSLLGKTTSGSIIELISYKFPHNTIIEVNGEKLALQLSPEVIKKLKVGDDVSFKISGYLTNLKTYNKNNNLIKEQNEKIYTVENVFDEKGKALWIRPTYAFLYEKNQVRFANSKIEKITKNANQEIERILLNDGEFKIDLNLADLKLINNSFNVGDRVTARFIGERQTSPKYYITNKMITIYNESNNTSLINNNLYSKFYSEDGKQIQKTLAIETKPILLDHQEVALDFNLINKAIPNNKTKTLVIDAGHGGQDDATKSMFTGKTEKYLNLRVALILKDEAEKRGIKVIMTREKDEFITLKDRVQFQKGADAFISIHHNSMPMNKKTNQPESMKGFRGFEVFISDNSLIKESKVLGEKVLNALQSLESFPVRDSLINKNVYVVREAIIPSILIEFPNLAYKEGNDFIGDEKKLMKACKLILDGFEKSVL